MTIKDTQKNPPIASVARGPALVRGFAQSDELLRAPISGRPCVAWRITALTLSMSPRLLFDRADWAPGFKVGDDSGSLAIEPGGFALDFTSRWAIEITGYPHQEEIPSSWLRLCEEEGISPWPEEPWLGRTLIVEGTLPPGAEILVRGQVEQRAVAGAHPYREPAAAARLCRGEEGGLIWMVRPGRLVPGLGAVTGLGLTSLGMVTAGFLEVGGLLALLTALCAAWLGHPEPDLLALWRMRAPARRSSVADLQSGPATVRGSVEPVDAPVLAPLSLTPCVACEVSLWQEDGLVQHLLMRSSSAASALWLRDASGRVLVEGEPEVRLSRPVHTSMRGAAGERLPDVLRPLLLKSGIPIPGDGRAPFRWYAEERVLLPGEEASLTGWASLQANRRRLGACSDVSLQLSG